MFDYLKMCLYIYRGSGFSSTESTMLHCHFSTVALNGQTKLGLYKGSLWRDVQSMRSATSPLALHQRHWILHTWPIMFFEIFYFENPRTEVGLIILSSHFNFEINTWLVKRRFTFTQAAIAVVCWSLAVSQFRGCDRQQRLLLHTPSSAATAKPKLLLHEMV